MSICRPTCFLGLISLILTAPVGAQILPDSSVGTRVTPNVEIKGVVSEVIDGGTIRGANLFHSFSEFNIQNAGGAYFTNPAGISNILTRITGLNPSNINGILGVLGNANLFILNPNGIIFGSNARLDLNGSFVATTANAIKLANGDIFAANFDSSLPNQLLNVNPNAFLFNQIATQPIINRSITGNAGLQVNPGRSLLLLGGDINLEGGRLQTSGGRIELAAVRGIETVGLSVDGSNLQLNVPAGIQLADISLTNGARVDVSAAVGGHIAVNSQNLNMTTGSRLQGGISGVGSPQSQAGNIEINVPGTINLNASGVLNSVADGAEGNAGNVNLSTGTLFVTNGGFVSAITRGKGNAGNVNIRATDVVSFDGVDGSGNPSLASVASLATAVGNAGNLNITTASLSLTNGALLSSATLGQGNGGSININANTVSFDGNAPNGSPTFAYTGANQAGAGNAGDLNITTGSLSVTNGAYLATSTNKKGNAGNVNINANTVTFDGVGRNGDSTYISSAVVNRGEGKAGNVNIDTDSLFVTNGAFVSAATLGKGNGGSVNINANTVSLDGVGSNRSSSFISTAVNPTAVGDGGDININTRSLSVTNGARVTNITLAQGKGGNVTINTNNLEVLSGGQILTTTFNSGNAGNITINASDNITLTGSNPNPQLINENIVVTNGSASGVFASTFPNATGTGGDLRITAGRLVVQDGAQVSVSSQGTGGAGNLSVSAASIFLNNSGSLSSEVRAGFQGNITLNAGEIVLRRGSHITTNATDTATGGNIAINADTLVALEDSDITANAFIGRGGNINITTEGMFRSADSDITAASQLGISGVVNVSTLNFDQQNLRVEQSSEFVNVDTVVASSCLARRNGSAGTFVVTGNGGLPETPDNALVMPYELVSVLAVGANSNTDQMRQQTSAPSATTWKLGDPIVEATEFSVNADGQVVLTAKGDSETAAGAYAHPHPIPCQPN